jgi:prevent-host-death family protein
MKIVSLADVKARLSGYLDQARETGPVVITRNGKAVALLIVPENEDDLEWLLLSRSPRLREILNRSRKSIAEKGAIPWDSFWQTVEAGQGAAALAVHEEQAKYKTGE